LFAVGLVPRASGQETGIVHIRATINVSDINFKDGKLVLYGLHLTVDANSAFCVYFFSPSMYWPNYWDQSSIAEDDWSFLTRDYFSNGIEVKFKLKEIIFLNEVLEYTMVIGLNVTAYDRTRNVYTDLNLPLQDEWHVNGTVVEVSAEEAAPYTLYGMEAINSSIQNYNIKDFYILRIQISRKPDVEKALNWLPPIAMFCLLLVSILVIWKGSLSNSLRIYLAVAFPSITYLSFLREITPPIMTSIEWFTLLDVGLCFILAILAVLVNFARPKRRKATEETPNGKKSQVLEKNEKETPLDKKKARLVEYGELTKSTWNRGRDYLMLQSILVSGSLLAVSYVARNITEMNLMIARGVLFGSILLILLAYVFYYTTEKIDNKYWDSIHKIEHLIGIEVGHHGLRDQIEKEWWFRLRKLNWDVILGTLGFFYALALAWTFVFFH